MEGMHHQASSGHRTVLARPIRPADGTADQDVASGRRRDFDLRIGPVAKRLGETTVRMLAYNGSIPGPTFQVRQGSRSTVQVTNDGDMETTVHWHGLRLENRYDGVPHETQTPIPVGGTFTYHLRFPDPGLYWYHPHIREDYTQELGLYGNILVEPRGHGLLAARAPRPSAHPRRCPDRGRAASPRSVRPASTHTAMGRFGNVLLVDGDTDLGSTARAPARSSGSA